MTKFNTRDVAQEVTASITKAIEAGFTDGGKGWKRPWRTIAPEGMTGVIPVSIHGRSYRGANHVILMLKAQANDWSNIWGTYNGFKKIGAQVRKGEKGTLVVLWKWIPVKDKATGEKKTIPIVKGFTVFNASQVDGYEPKTPRKPKEVKGPEVLHQEAHAMLAAYLERAGVGFNEGGDRAFYNGGSDAITMPLHKAFKTDGDYIATMAHEAGHSTGHKSRLDRTFGARFGDEAYAFEELVAELTACMFCCHAEIQQPDMIDEQHVEYVKSWLKALRNDKGAILTAAGKAQRAVDLVMDITWAEDEAEDDTKKAA